MNNIKNLINDRKEQDRIEVTEKGAGWWLPEKETDLIIADKKGQLVPDQEKIKENIKLADKFICYIEPLNIIENESSNYENESYLLQYMDWEAEAIRETPLRGNLLNKIADLAEIERDKIFKMLFNSDPDKKSLGLFKIRYCGKLESMKENDNKFYHTFTGEIILNAEALELEKEDTPF